MSNDIYLESFRLRRRQGGSLKILLSVRPKWMEMILDGRKTLEYRRTMPRPHYDVTEAWFYETAPVCMVVAHAYVSVWCGDVFDEHKGCLARDEYDSYFKGAECAYGLHIVRLDKFEPPYRLECLGLKRPPQSWMYMPEVAKGKNACECVQDVFLQRLVRVDG